jgi:hypothetical protein
LGLTEKWRKLHNEELNSLYSSPNIIRVIKSRKMKWAGHVARMRERRGRYRILLGKPERKSPLARPMLRWKRNIRMDLQEEGCGDMDWVDLDKDRDMLGTREPGNEPPVSIKCCAFLD